jgi:tetratricopeptide (TPR) repeat protein
VADANGILLTFAKLTLIVIIIVAWSSILSPVYFGSANLITSVAAQQNSEEEDLFFRGNNAYQQGRYEEAIEYFDRVLIIDPNHVGALIINGLALDSLGRSEEAIEYYDTALDIDPNYVDALYNIGLALDSLGR